MKQTIVEGQEWVERQKKVKNYGQDFSKLKNSTKPPSQGVQ